MAESDYVAELQRENARLHRENEKLSTESKRRRQGGKALQTQLDEALRKVQDLTGSNEQLQQKLTAAPTEKDARIAQLEGEIREGKHRSAYAKAAKAAGVDEARLDDFYSLSGYKPEGDLDEAAVTAHVAEAIKARPYFGQATPPPDGGKTGPDGPQKGAQAPALPPGPGSRQGATPPASGGSRRYTAAEVQDPVFAMKHAADISAAAKDGRIDWSAK